MAVKKKAPQKRPEAKEEQKRPGLRPRFSSLSRKEKAILCGAAVLILAGIGVLICFLARPAKVTGTGKNTAIVYFPVDYDEDILRNEVYLSFDRDLYFSASGVTVAYNEANIEEASRECRFFYDFLQTVIRGEYETYPSFFLDPAANEAKFTMQMLYDITVNTLDPTEEEIGGETVTVQNYAVRFAIHRNNGTYRTGVRSDAKTTQVYQLADTDEGYRIWRILDVVMGND